jgi:hypothetical protein
MTLLNLLPWFHWDYGIFFKNVQVRSRGLIETTETDPAVSLRPQKPIPRSHWNRGSQSCSLIASAGIRTLQTIISNVSAIRSQMWNGFSPWISALGGIVWWKNEGRKSRDTFPLKLTSSQLKSSLVGKTGPCVLWNHGLGALSKYTTTLIPRIEFDNQIFPKEAGFLTRLFPLFKKEDESNSTFVKQGKRF